MTKANATESNGIGFFMIKELKFSLLL
jgi:hypothetical protein